MRSLKVNYINAGIVFYILCAIIADSGSILMQLSRLVIVGLFSVRIIRGKKAKFTTYTWWTIFFGVFALVSTKWAWNKIYAMAMSKTLLINGICMFALMNLIITDASKVRLALKTCVCAPLILEIRVIISGGLFVFLNARSIAGISGNALGLCAAFGACIAIYFIKMKTETLFFKFFFLINVMIVVLSASRKAFLCILIPLLFVFVLNNREHFFAILWKIIAAIVLIALAYIAVIKVPFLYNTVGHRMESMIAALFGNSQNADSSASTRMRLIAWGIEWFNQAPWFGHGIDNYRAILVRYHPDYPTSYYAHNNYIELLVDVGIVGTFIYYWNYLSIFAKCIKKRKSLSYGELLFTGMLFSLMINEYGLVSYYDKYIQMLILLIWCATDGYLKSKESTQ